MIVVKDGKGNEISIEKIYDLIHNRNHEFTTEHAGKLQEFLDGIIAAYLNNHGQELGELIYKADTYLLEMEDEHL